MTTTDSHRVIPSSKGQTFPVETLTQAEVNAILGACSRRGMSGIRNRAMFGLMYRAGLRLQEALDLQPRDVDLDAGSVNVRDGKGGKQRVVGFDAGAGALVAQWLAVRAKLDGVNGKAPLFCQITTGKEGEPLNPVYVRKALKAAAAKAGIDKRVHPHGLRHSMASELANERVPLHVIAAQLGHSSVATTDRYLQKIAPHELVKAMQAREWSEPA